MVSRTQPPGGSHHAEAVVPVHAFVPFFFSFRKIIVSLGEVFFFHFSSIFQKFISLWMFGKKNLWDVKNSFEFERTFDTNTCLECFLLNIHTKNFGENRN